MKQHEENLTVIRGGQGVTVGAGYYTTVAGYCEAHGLEIPEKEREFEPDPVVEEVPAQTAALPSIVFLEAGEGEHEGLVRKVYLEDWREPVEADTYLEAVVTYDPASLQDLGGPKEDRLNVFPTDLRERLIAINGVGERLADTIIKAISPAE